MTRDGSQQKFIDLWIKNNYFGSLIAVTGWGKTICSIKAIIQSNAKSTIVIVPTIDLKKQWTKKLKEFKVNNSEVLVVNTAVKKDIDCDLLIIDECHKTGMADWFSLSWKQAKFNKLIALSATMFRKDNKHRELLNKAPLLMTITFEEALLNNWVSNYEIYNIGLDFSREEQVIYDTIESKLNRIYEEVALIEKLNIDYVKKNMFNIARRLIGNKEDKTLFLHGLNYNKLINQRKSIIYSAQAKKDKTLWLLRDSKLNNKKAIVFSQTQEFADYIYNNFKSETEVIHSDMKTKNRELALKRFNDGRTKKRILSTVKAFNEGIDIPSLEVGIIASGTSSKTDIIQQIGRVIRLDGDKKSIIINLYIKNSQDFIWTKNKFYGFDKSKINWK